MQGALKAVKQILLELKEHFIKTLLEWMKASGRLFLSNLFDLIDHYNFRIIPQLSASILSVHLLNYYLQKKKKKCSKSVG